MTKAETVTIYLVEREHLALSAPLAPLPWQSDCVLCGCEVYGAVDGGCVWDGENVVCMSCGAVDCWTVDEEEETAHLVGMPDDGPTVDVLREVWDKTGRASWEDRARNVDTRIEWLVRDGQTTRPLLEDTP